MISSQNLVSDVKDIFLGINRDSMAGLPIVNARLDVETIGFTEFEGRVVGVIITPWMMSLAIFPGEGDDWTDKKVGQKQSFNFPSRPYDFKANEIDGLGIYFSYALYSPMEEFEHQDHVIACATAFMETLMMEIDEADDVLDEERLEKFLAGEDMQSIKQNECAAANPVVDGEITLRDKMPESIDRRSLLRGSLCNKSKIA